MEYYKIEIPGRVLAHWARLEDENQHGRRLYSIAHYFYQRVETEPGAGAAEQDFFEVEQLLNQINALHEMSRDGLSEFVYNVRTACRLQLRAAIANYFGYDVLNKVDP